MNPKIDQISRELDISTDELITKSLLSYLEHELRLAESDIADLRDKYFVISRLDLEDKIKNKTVQSHPAWENLIAWENLEMYTSNLKKQIKGF